MATTATSTRANDGSDSQELLPLHDGDRMGREEFHRRYQAMGPDVRAELIEGVVHLHTEPDMASPVSLSGHGTPVFDAALWLDADALLAGATAKLLVGIEQGCATTAHAEFARRVARIG